MKRIENLVMGGWLLGAVVFVMVLVMVMVMGTTVESGTIRVNSFSELLVQYSRKVHS